MLFQFLLLKKITVMSENISDNMTNPKPEKYLILPKYN